MSRINGRASRRGSVEKLRQPIAFNTQGGAKPQRNRDEVCIARLRLLELIDDGLVQPSYRSRSPNIAHTRPPMRRQCQLLSLLLGSTRGKRTRGDMSFSRLSAYLTGAGLVSLKSACVNFMKIGREALSLTDLTPLQRQVHVAAQTRCDIRCDRNAAVAALSNESQSSRDHRPTVKRKSVPNSALSRSGRVMSPVASFSPMNCGLSARRATVASARPHTVRDGTS